MTAGGFSTPEVPPLCIAQMGGAHFRTLYYEQLFRYNIGDGGVDVKDKVKYYSGHGVEECVVRGDGVYPMV